MYMSGLEEEEEGDVRTSVPDLAAGGDPQGNMLLVASRGLFFGCCC